MDDFLRQRKAKKLFETRMKEVREERGSLTLRNIAEESGLSLSLLSGYTNGNILGARFSHVVRLLYWMKIDPDEFCRELELFPYTGNEEQEI